LFTVALSPFAPSSEKKMKRLFLTLIVVAAGVAQASAQPAAGGVREYVRSHEHEILGEFVGLLSIPNVAADRENIRRNAAHIVEMMRRAGPEPAAARSEESGGPARRLRRADGAQRDPHARLLRALRRPAHGPAPVVRHGSVEWPS
jgi:hypothetical protein